MAMLMGLMLVQLQHPPWGIREVSAEKEAFGLRLYEGKSWPDGQSWRNAQQEGEKRTQATFHSICI